MQHVVIGLGKTGIELARYLKKHHQAILVMDSRAKPPELPAWRAIQTDQDRCILGQLNWSEVNNNSTIWLSPGLPPNLLPDDALVARSIQIKSDIDILMTRQQRPKIIAVTGSNGKSTVVEMIQHLLKINGFSSAIAGNNARPAVTLIDNHVDYWIVEVSSFQLHYSADFSPDVGLLLNISVDHQDWHQSMLHYINSKIKCINRASCAIVYRPILSNTPIKNTKLISFDDDNPSADWTTINQQIYAAGKPITGVIHMPIQRLNLLAAFATIHALVDQPVVEVYQPKLPYRLALTAVINDCYWYNDSKATNIAAMQAALQTINHIHSQPIVVLILGGFAKCESIPEIDDTLFQIVKCVIAFGQAADWISHWVPKSTQVVRCEHLIDTMTIADRQSHDADVVLFSPACASFDQYTSYLERGRHFDELLRNISETVSC